MPQSEEIIYKGKRIFPLRYMSGDVQWRVSEPANAAFLEWFGSRDDAEGFIDAGCPAGWKDSSAHIAWRERKAA